MTVTESLILHG